MSSGTTAQCAEVATYLIIITKNIFIFNAIVKIIGTRCQILRLKCTKSISAAGGAYSAPPDPLAGFKGALTKR